MEKLKELIKIIGPGNFVSIIVLIVLCATFLAYKHKDNEFTLEMTKLGYTNCNPGITIYTTWVKDCTEYYKLRNEIK